MIMGVHVYEVLCYVIVAAFLVLSVYVCVYTCMIMVMMLYAHV
jgi:hypothetical protein